MTSGAALDPYHTPLWDLGIEETEPMVCEDSFDNRRTLRNNKFMWSALTDPDTGMPTGLIRVFTPEELTARRESVWDTKKPIMEEPGNAYSEYVGPRDLEMDADIPWWVKLRLRGWVEDELSGKPEEKRRRFPERCEVIRTDGTRCWSWAPAPNKAKRCKKHLAWEMDTDQANAKLAKLRMLQMAPAAADTLEGLMLDANESGAVRLKASTEILDRAGVRGGVELDISGELEVKDAGAEVSDRLTRLAERMAEAEKKKAELLAELEAATEKTDIVEGVVVEDEPEK